MPVTKPNYTVNPYQPSEDVPFPDTSLLVTDDGAPVDNLFTEKQQRLLVEPLYTSWAPLNGRPFRAMCNVGLFHAYKDPPVVPDAMLALDVQPTDGIQLADNRSYFMWVVGKPPDIVIEVVSNNYGGESTTKLHHYSKIGVHFYVIFDPFRNLNSEMLRVFSWNNGVYELTDPAKINHTGLGLKLWEGEYEFEKAVWLRWCDADGKVIQTGKERLEQLEEELKTLKKEILKS